MSYIISIVVSGLEFLRWGITLATFFLLKFQPKVEFPEIVFLGIDLIEGKRSMRSQCCDGTAVKALKGW